MFFGMDARHFSFDCVFSCSFKSQLPVGVATYRIIGRCVICAMRLPWRSRYRGFLPQSGTPMLLCPAQSQTSPTRTSFISTAPAFNVRPLQLAFMAKRSTRQRPSVPATVSIRCPANSTTTFSCGSARPHTGTLRSLCRTIWSANGDANCTTAKNTLKMLIAQSFEENQYLCRSSSIFRSSLSP